MFMGDVARKVVRRPSEFIIFKNLFEFNLNFISRDVKKVGLKIDVMVSTMACLVS